MADEIIRTCFLLTAECLDLPDRFEMIFWAAPLHTDVPIKIVVDNFRPLFFIPSSAKIHNLHDLAERRIMSMKTMDGVAVDCLYFKTHEAMKNAAASLRHHGIAVFESDIHPLDRYLMERHVAGTFTVEGESHFVNHALFFRNPKMRGFDGSVPLKTMSIDIETNETASLVYSIACSGETDAVFITGPEIKLENVRCFHREKDMLLAFFAHVKTENPDLLIGWNIVGFDFNVMQTRCRELGIHFDIGREWPSRIYPQSNDPRKFVAKIPGRAVLDGPLMLRAGGRFYESLSLENVASDLLGEHKTITLEGSEKTDEINRLFAHDKQSLAIYNLQDAVLTRRVFDAAGLIPNAIERSKRSGLMIDRIGGSVAAFDHVYLPRLHRAGFVAGDLADIPLYGQQLIGGFVIEPDAGLYEHVILLDFKSLYPSIMRTFCIDPLAQKNKTSNMVKNPAGTSFARDLALMPVIVEELLDARAQAKRDHNEALSNAIKVLMNSFYGVLGSTGCRFFDPQLAESITLSGQQILRRTIAYIENEFECRVLYGDTDSVFVLFGPDAGFGAIDKAETIVASVNKYFKKSLKDEFGVESFLELEFDQHFIKLLIPTSRSGSGKGTKKRYCGLIANDGIESLVFKGMESARTDWTNLAKTFQQKLYMMVFHGEPVEEYICSVVADLKDGRLDDLLIYSKRLRKDSGDYENGHIPPHAQAAKLLDKPGSRIRYIITKAGPQPIGKISSPPDYNHYVETQLRPVADSILETIGKNFDEIAGGKISLF